MTTNVPRFESRSVALLKLAVLILAYGAALWIFLGTLENLFIDKFHVHGSREDFALASLIRTTASPATAGFALSAWLLRSRWLDLSAAQLLVPAIAMAIVTPLIYSAVFMPSHYALRYDRFSISAWRVASWILLFITGLLVAQLLRLRRKPSTLNAGLSMDW